MTFVDDQETLLTSTICVYEVLEGGVFGSDSMDLVGTRRAFGRIESVAFTESVAIEAARLQSELLDTGDPLAPRDLMIAATARSTGDDLAVTDAGFRTDVLEGYLTVTDPRS